MNLSLADQIRAARATTGKSQQELAAMAVCAASTVADAERGERPSVEVLRRLAIATGATFTISADTDVGRPR